MASVDVISTSGSKTGSVELDDKVFGVQLNVPLMHQVVTAQLAARRRGTHSTKTRAEVAGGGAKPWRQKGTGRSRQGSIRAPQWRGGGVALGPKPRNYRQRTPKKMIRAALHCALSDRAADGKVVVVDQWDWTEPKTKQARQMLEALGLDGRVLLVVDRSEEIVAKSFRNLPTVHLVEPGELNAYDVLVSDWVVFTRANLPTAAAEIAGPSKTLVGEPGGTRSRPRGGSTSANDQAAVAAPAAATGESEAAGPQTSDTGESAGGDAR